MENKKPVGRPPIYNKTNESDEKSQNWKTYKI